MSRRKCLGYVFENVGGDPVGEVIYVSDSVDAIHVRMPGGRVHKITKIEFETLRAMQEARRKGGAPPTPPTPVDPSRPETLEHGFVTCGVCGQQHEIMIRGGVPDPPPECPRGNVDGELTGWTMPPAGPGSIPGIDPIAARLLGVSRAMATYDVDALDRHGGRALSDLAREIRRLDDDPGEGF